MAANNLSDPKALKLQMNISMGANRPTVTPDDAGGNWRTEITAICGGDDIGTIHRYTVKQGWPYALESYSFGDHLEQTPVVEVRLDFGGTEDILGESTEDPTEALARAILAAHEATGDGR